MNKKTYCLVSGVFFGVVAALHVLRLVNGWAVQIGSFAVPKGASVIGFLVAACLCVWAFRSAKE